MNNRLLISLSGFLVVAAGFITAPQALASEDNCANFGGGFTEEFVELGGQSQCPPDVNTNAPAPDIDMGPVVPPENLENNATPSKYRYWEESGCSDTAGNLEPLCLKLAPSCGSDKDLVQTWRILNKPDQDPRSAEKVGELRCVGASDPQLPRAEEEPVVTLEDFQRLGIISSKVSIQPQPHTLIRAHNNFYAVAETQNFDITLIGKAVKVRATPGSYTWNYGDGTTRGPITDAGGPVHETHWGEETATSYAYPETGDYDIQLTTSFRGEFSVEGGPWQAIRGQAQVASEPVTLSVWRSESRNVSETCAENPEGWGC